MKRTLALAALLLGALAVYGCVPPTEPDPQPNINVCGGVGSCGGQVGASPSPSPSGSPSTCPVVTQVTDGLLGGGGATTIRINSGQLLAVTPRNGNTEVPANCHGGTVQWSTSGTATCALSGNVTGFTPTITCSTVGTVTSTAVVAPPGGQGSTTFNVTN